MLVREKCCEGKGNKGVGGKETRRAGSKRVVKEEAARKKEVLV